jgi:hypothetical protein
MTRFYHNSKQSHRSYSGLFHNSTTLFSAILLLLLLFVTSCEEKPTIIGSGLLPASDFVNIKSDSTLKVEAYTRYLQSVVTTNRSYSYIGRLYDQYFGETSSDFVGQLRLLQPWPGGGPFSVDSVKFYCIIQGAKGKLDSTVVHQIILRETTQQLTAGVKYYSDQDPDTAGGKNFGIFPLPIIKKDTVTALDATLPIWVGEYLMRDTTKLSQEGDANDFRSFFKGLYVGLADSPDPFLAAMTFSTTDFTIRVYYHSYKSGLSLFYDFVMNANSVRYNRYIHNFSSATAPAKIQPSHFTDQTKDTMIYLQGLNGAYPQLIIPGLENLKKTFQDSIKVVSGGTIKYVKTTSVSINKARLFFSVLLDSTNYVSTDLPAQILMKYTVSDTLQYVVPDIQVSTPSTAFYGGTFNSTTTTYSFNLASFLQEYLKGKIVNPALEMYFAEGEFRNVILKANSSKSPVKFYITGSRFSEPKSLPSSNVIK